VPVDVYAEDLPAGSHKIIVYLGGEYGAPYDAICIASPFLDGALLHGLHGTINRRVLCALMEYGRKQGYTVAYFARTHGFKYTRFAQFAFCRDGMNFYRVKL
jgi:molybdopterin-guanine dinucleotide biosynthesis protein A